MGRIFHTYLGNDKIYLKKDWIGWRTIDPLRDPDTKQWIWKNLFNKRGFIVLGFLLLLLTFSYLGFKEQINNYRLITQNPCAYCIDCQSHTNELIKSIDWKPQEIKHFNISI